MSIFDSGNVKDCSFEDITVEDPVRNGLGCVSREIRYSSGDLLLRVYVNDLEVICSSELTLLKFRIPTTIIRLYEGLDSVFGVTARTALEGRICVTTTDFSLIPKNIDQSKFLLLEIHIHSVYHTESGTILVNVLHAHGSSKK